MVKEPVAADHYLTLAELLQHGPLAGVTAYGPADRTVDVRDVRIADHLDALDELQPHTAVVLTGLAASAAWTIEMALRKAWEHAAACVVVARGAGNAESAADLAERLGVPLLVVAGSALDAAVRIASAVAQPEAGRTALLATAARRITAAGPRPVRIVSALHAVLPSTDVALVAPSGEVIAGRSAALDAPAGAVGVRVEVPDPEGGPLAVLAASSRSRVAGWESTVREVLGLAVAPLTAWAARERLTSERLGLHASGLLAELVARGGAASTPQDQERGQDQGRHPAQEQEQEQEQEREPSPAEGRDPLLMQAVALGWPVRGPFVVYVVRPAEQDRGGALLASWWSRTGPGGPLVAHEGCWVAWEQQDEPSPARDPLARAGEKLRAALVHPSLLVPVAGAVAGPAKDLAGLGPVLAAAVAAVRVTRPGTVVRADRTGPEQLLAAVPRDVLRGPAESLLAALLEADRDGSLLRTLAVVLDVATPSAAAARLGVHRNTVTARVERLRALGCDPEDPSLRLALHLACRVLLDDRSGGPSTS
ncbi:PucR family transcriptional regulator [Streptomyces sp. NPDC059385]|uniref:PucR family transcriptional regulator n=1 Tax=Streptomyces sp. NPDC059385 TaxID=3346817 RepID=UPI00368C1818